jgi:hypothetical protein
MPRQPPVGKGGGMWHRALRRGRTIPRSLAIPAFSRLVRGGALAQSLRLSVILTKNRLPLFGIMLYERLTKETPHEP